VWVKVSMEIINVGHFNLSSWGGNNTMSKGPRPGFIPLIFLDASDQHLTLHQK
jgi:hypothetical protein